MEFSNKDLQQIREHGLTPEAVEAQIQRFATGFPTLHVAHAATIDNGVIALSQNEETECVYAWEDYLHTGGTVEKFVPASGAASRMFKNMFAFANGDSPVPTTDFELRFFEGIKRFAFYEALDAKCKEVDGVGVDELIAAGNHRRVAQMLLFPEGLNYGNKPKGVLLFHRVEGDVHTAIEEHMEEGAQYATDKDGNVNLHFTVSPEHRSLFEEVIEAKREALERRYGVKFRISMSEQKSSTDTIAVNLDNTPFRNPDGSLLFRPAGHGALIENLNEREARVIFVKNIDNVVPADKRAVTLKYKKIIGGYLILLQRSISKYVKLLRKGTYTINDLRNMIHFLHDKLCTRDTVIKTLDDDKLAAYLLKKFDRPIRVCGVVRNDGEPGGGPFIAVNRDGSISPQIMESSQFTDETAELLQDATHFNPVDLVCYTADSHGDHYDLTKYVDPDTGFISSKSKDGKELKALELPGLWNGAMSDWNTAFIEVPIDTFNPVKTVNDLLRPMHQPAE